LHFLSIQETYSSVHPTPLRDPANFVLIRFTTELRTMMETAKLNIDKIYVVHGITGYEDRERRLIDLLGKQYKLNYEFVTESHHPDENDLLIKKYFIPEIKTTLSKGAIYCTLVHFLIYERFLSSDSQYAILFENDVCFLGSFTEKIPLIIKEASHLKEGFIISLENSTLRFPSWRVTKKGKFLYEATQGRCAGGYLIDRTAAQIMLDELMKNKCAAVIDWWHNQLLDKKLLTMYWAHPPLIEQGSFNGTLASSISKRNDGGIRRIRWSIQKFFKMYVVRFLKG
jgi:glycosyl transferase, family 25